MKKIIFALTACFCLTLFATQSFAQTKVKKGKLKVKKGVLQQPEKQIVLRDTVWNQKSTNTTNQQIGTSNKGRISKNKRGQLQKGPTVPGSIWDTIPPQVKGGKATPRLQNRQTVKRSKTNLRQAKGDKLQQTNQVRKKQKKGTPATSKAIQKRRKTTKKNNY